MIGPHVTRVQTSAHDVCLTWREDTWITKAHRFTISGTGMEPCSKTFTMSPDEDKALTTTTGVVDFTSLPSGSANKQCNQNTKNGVGFALTKQIKLMRKGNNVNKVN